MLRKYPRTPHLPWSEGATSDDRMLADARHFEGQEVVVTEKMDGENTTMYRDHIHARSLDSLDHASRRWVKGLHGQIAHEIPEDYRICGENLFAQHSIHYENLPSYFLAFSVWRGPVCLSWDETEEWAKLLGLELVPVLWRGVWDPHKMGFDLAGRWHPDQGEGYVVRVASDFLIEDFGTSVAKYVRKNHVQTDEHWMSKPVVPNGLRKP